MTILDMGAMGVSAWRLSSLVVNEAGPLGCFLRLRERLGISHDASGLPAVHEGDGLAALFSCVWCVSVWMAGLVYLIWWLSPVPVYILAVSGLAIMAHELIERVRR